MSEPNSNSTNPEQPPAPSASSLSEAAPQPQAQDDDSSSSSPSSSIMSRRRKLFGDCALVEIIHLHDCLRGAIKALEHDVTCLHKSVMLFQENTTNENPPGDNNNKTELMSDLERRVTGRFKVIWSVFRAHSSAEDEFIWPALQRKTQGRISGSPPASPKYDHHNHPPTTSSTTTSNNNSTWNATSATENSNSNHNHNATAKDASSSTQENPIEQEEYEEDHADEERMFSSMDNLLTKLRASLVLSQEKEEEDDDSSLLLIEHTMKEINDLSKQLTSHLMVHLEKEENQCLPLVAKHLSKSEIHDLVGQIMGKRSSDMIAQIMTMAVQNLNETDREEMVKYMKQAMAGTFFDRWLSMSGWMTHIDSSSSSTRTTPASAMASSTTTSTPTPSTIKAAAATTTEKKRDAEEVSSNMPAGLKDDGAGSTSKTEQLPSMTPTTTTSHNSDVASVAKKIKIEQETSTGEQEQEILEQQILSIHDAARKNNPAGDVTSQAELEKLIRAIASNTNLTAKQKNTTIQGLRDSVWKSNQLMRRQSLDNNSVNANGTATAASTAQTMGLPHGSSTTTNGGGEATTTASAAATLSCTPSRRVTPPSMYFKKNPSGKTELVYTCDGPISNLPSNIPLFSATELAPTYHDGATGAVLGCPHYARACKLRHPQSGRLYTCRLCCEQDREMPMKDQDEPLDRYAVNEVMCMKCNTLQPAEDRCLNTQCESHGKAFAKYFCRICHLYDDRPRPIFHCPYCNTCRMGLGLGIDFRHCMRCNACVSLSDGDHRCIPQKLGSCPICYESLFQSTEPLKGLACGHVMHMKCFTEYRRGQHYTCPLCMRSMEDMSDYFALLDAAVRMQPMPAAFLSTKSNIYCQDCEQTGQCPYHFVGLKCPNCGSYNTREMGRVQS